MIFFLAISNANVGLRSWAQVSWGMCCFALDCRNLNAFLETLICVDSVTDCFGMPTQGWGSFLIAGVFRHRPIALC